VFLSLAFHVVVGLGAVEAGRQVIVPMAGPKAVPVLYVIPADPPVIETPPNAPFAPAGPAGPADPIVVTPPVEVPIGIPPVEPGAPIDPRRFVFEPARPRCSDCVIGRDSGVALFSEAAVDEPARVLSQPAPIFPAVLKAAGVGGRVVVQFVVDTVGIVEPGSMSFSETSHPAFESSARMAIEHSRFAPARIRGQAVRQLVRQSIRFEIRP
jgi:protein TonB